MKDTTSDNDASMRRHHGTVEEFCGARISRVRQEAVRARWGKEVVGKSSQIRCGTAEAKALRAYAKRAGLPTSVAASRAIRRYLGLDGGSGAGDAK